ncbi:MAG TPA: anti-sigma factor [Micromonosporaceae bacterium]|nr:anti-sigma factor [Micromonosporaceae bacterium]
MTEATDIHALAGAYALDAVDDLERAAFARHLHQCETCALEVAELRETTTRMAGAMAQAPPPGMRDAVLAAVARTPQERPGSADRGSHGRADPVTRWRRFTAAAVAAGVLVGGGGLASWRVTNAQLEAERAASAQSRQIDAVINAPDAKVHTEEMATGGQVVVVVSQAQGRAVAVLNGLRTPGQDELYQIWLQPRGTTDMNSVGVLPPGQNRGTVLIGAEVTGADAVGVSVEPAPRGSDHVTEEKITGAVKLT